MKWSILELILLSVIKDENGNVCSNIQVRYILLVVVKPIELLKISYILCVEDILYVPGDNNSVTTWHSW
jgi:hypothetical protein